MYIEVGYYLGIAAHRGWKKLLENTAYSCMCAAPKSQKRSSGHTRRLK